MEAFTGTPGANGAPAEGGGSKEVEKLIKNQLGGLMYNGVSNYLMYNGVSNYLMYNGVSNCLMYNGVRN